MTDIRTVPINQLRFGHEADPPINARKVGRDDNVDELLATMRPRTKGGPLILGQALNVREIGGENFVKDGNRRLLAARKLAEACDIALDYHIKCDFDDLGVDDDELSMMLNIEHAPMHDADTFEKFRDLHDRGQSVEQMAFRFGVEEKRVRKFLALGRLHPDILEAWRSDELVDRWGRGTVEILHALTLAPDIETQGKVFHKLKKAEQLYAQAIRREFGADNDEVKKALKLVGIEVYRAAGGAVTEDLFGENHVIADPALAIRLADEKLEAECQRLVDEGWSWVGRESELPQGWTWAWEKLRPESRELDDETAKKVEALEVRIGELDPDDDEQADQIEELQDEIEKLTENASEIWTPEQKAKAGCVVARNHAGVLVITRGVVKPEAAKDKSAAPDKPKEKAEARLSEALLHRLSVQMTKAAQASIHASPRVALAALLASVADYDSSKPFRAKFEGMGAVGSYRKSGSFEASFKRFLAMTESEMLIALGAASERAISMEGANVPSNKACVAFLTAMDGTILSANLAVSFDAEDYFKTAPKTFAIAAIEEAINADEARKAGKLKKGELVKFAVENVPKTGWLPREMRTVHYAGPGAAKPKEKRTRKAKEAAQ